MRVGYPCINLTLGCKPTKTFRLKNYSEDLLIEKVKNNLACLLEILKFNQRHRLLFFRITSDLVPFASHPVCRFDWERYFKEDFKRIGDFIKKNKMRVTMHPDQFVLLNAKRKEVVEASVRELVYHEKVLSLLGQDESAKIQIHLGGVYGDKEESLKRFLRNYERLPKGVKKRLVIENDERSYNLEDCLLVSQETGLPVVFDYFHHRLNPSFGKVSDCLLAVAKTWEKRDGNLIVDYSSPKKDARFGSHAGTIDLRDFRRFLAASRGIDFDLMLEIKNKEKSALKAIKVLTKDQRLR